MNTYLIIILATLVVSWAVDTLCGVLTVRSLAPGLPVEFRDVYDGEQYRRSQEYSRVNSRFSLMSGTVSTVVTIAFVLAGGFGWADDMVRGFGLGELATGLVFVGLLAVIADLVSLPFDLYQTFVIEERFGFNRTTPWTYVADKFKGYFLGALLGGGLFYGVTAFFKHAGPMAWLYAWGAVAAFLVLVQYLAPTIILPLFNKFKPLEEGELRSAIEGYARGADLALSGIFVMDGSKRSAKSNAFFTGFGSTKRIALFDTLIERQSTDEIVAVLAHEVGHFKKRHILKNMLLVVGKLGFMLWLMSFFISEPALFEAFGVQRVSVYAGIVFFLMLYTPLSLLFGVAMGVLSRRYEYEADAFAARTTGRPGKLVAALKTLSRDNLSNLTPHPLVVFLKYSHPPVLARIRQLERVADRAA